MDDSNQKSQDIFGIRPYGDALNQSITKTFAGIEAFLKATCMPALEEVGLMMQDKVRVWRLNNILKIIEKAKNKLEYDGSSINIVINSKVALSIIENGSNEDNDEIQDMWAGLFATSNGVTNDSNIMFVNLLKQLSTSEAKYLNYACDNMQVVYNSKREQLFRSKKIISVEECGQITGISNEEDIESMFQHMISLNIVSTVHNTLFSIFGKDATGNNILYYPSTLGVQLYLRGIGFRGSIQDYIKTKPVAKTI